MANVTLNLPDGTTAVQNAAPEGLWYIDVYHGPTATPFFRIAAITTQAGALRIARNLEGKGFHSAVNHVAQAASSVTAVANPSLSSPQCSFDAGLSAGFAPFTYSWASSPAVTGVGGTAATTTGDWTGLDPDIYTVTVTVTDARSNAGTHTEYLGWDGTTLFQTSTSPGQPSDPTVVEVDTNNLTVTAPAVPTNAAYMEMGYVVNQSPTSGITPTSWVKVTTPGGDNNLSITGASVDDTVYVYLRSRGPASQGTAISSLSNAVSVTLT